MSLMHGTQTIGGLDKQCSIVCCCSVVLSVAVANSFTDTLLLSKMVT